MADLIADVFAYQPLNVTPQARLFWHHAQRYALAFDRSLLTWRAHRDAAIESMYAR